MSLTEAQYGMLFQIATQLINVERTQGKSIDFDNLMSYIDRAITFCGFTCDEDTKNKLFVELEYQFAIRHTSSECIFDDYDLKQWYDNKNIKDAFFWNRYRRYLSEKTSIDPVSINKLDEETLPNIMNCLGDPNEIFEGKRLRRGLIIGDVQSGKTATYSGLICKAADAGYKVVILLAGITESLRGQTQERIDDGIVGFTYRKVDKIVRSGRVGVGLDNKPRRATSFTTCIKDFVGDCDKIATTLNEHNSLVLFVVKKNVSVLNKMYKWLSDNNLDPVLQCVNQPMLLIDDEADNASVNTKRDETDPTKTNKIIRQICNLFKNANYVGFTATPFANVFIDPDSVDSMKHADLFPEHFIYVLPTPSNYIGAKQLFFEGEKCFSQLRYIVDIEEPDYDSDEYKDSSKNDIDTLNSGLFYSRHRKEWDGILPKSLREAVISFFIANIIRDLRGQQSTPRSMLVNMSRFIKVQNIIREHIQSIYDSVRNTIEHDFSGKIKEDSKLPLFQEIKSVFERHYSNVSDIAFSRICDKQNILKAIDKIKVIVVNGGKSSAKLDYKTNKSLRVIAVGGLALSRGLTLEGLITSYFYRNTSTFDVLMQMGRWFGYRTGYEDIFQVWTSRLSADWYKEIESATIELKEDIKQMFEQHLTPKDFGIRVRDYCDELSITSANKMRSAFELYEMQSYYGNICDTPYISTNVTQNAHNKEQVIALTKYLFDNNFDFRFADRPKHEGESVLSDNPSSRYFANVPKNVIIDFLSRIKCSMVNMRFNTDNILDFMQDCKTTGIDNWDVVFEGGDGTVYYDIPGLEKIRCANRAIEEHGNVIQISSRRRMLGLREGKFALRKEQIKLAEDLCRVAWKEEDPDATDESLKNRNVPLKAYFQYLPKRNPVLIIFLLQPNPPVPNKEEKPKLKAFREELGEERIVAFAIGFPGVKEAESAKKYKANKIYMQLHMQDEPEEIDDEEQVI
ncbi:Z1 domain-containing protein [Bacteroides fluxus]|uniref:Z1 domain-containing protein n=1 Tax=Bacteroides fluxus TaxID=626930 RepID=UPI0023529DE5|nr:Z1 domain-containing protein [Bacteroides fluxus]